MSNFVLLHRYDGGEPVLVNLDLVTTIEPYHTQGASLNLGEGEADGWRRVSESFEQLAALLNATSFSGSVR